MPPNPAAAAADNQLISKLTPAPAVPRRLLMFWLAVLSLLVALHLYPIRTGTIRALLVLGVIAFCSLTLAVVWRWKWMRLGCLAVGIAAALASVIPGRTVDTGQLRAGYVRALESYLGTKYIWGGESHRGIDCSGLIRCGLIDATSRMGAAGCNPALVREGVSLWWHDCSANELGEGYGGRALFLKPAVSLNLADYDLLQPGDFAVTSGGGHTLAYLGDKTWIEADPGEGRVLKVTIPARNPWFNHPVRLMRWRILTP